MRKYIGSLLAVPCLLAGGPARAQDAPAPPAPQAAVAQLPAVPPDIQQEFDLGQCQALLGASKIENAQLRYQVLKLTPAPPVAPTSPAPPEKK